MPNVSSAMPSTTGTKTALTLSASAWMGAREPCASRMSCTMRASTLSAPTVVARYWKAPRPLTVPPTTASPGPFITGIDSPVSIDSSTSLAPLAMIPSTGTRSPGRTTTSSPGSTSSMSMSDSAPPRTTRAVLGRRLASARSAEAVLRLARDSKALPVRMKAMMMITAS